jgi:DtxR family Mn-dependent transcriptional regulator
VKCEKHHGVRLTATGKTRALEVLRHHRLLERFLHDFLDYSWDEVHHEAECLEHFISERLEDRIAAKLGDPQTDPHGTYLDSCIAPPGFSWPSSAAPAVEKHSR